MDRYKLFQKLLTILADDAEIINAKMKNYSDNIEIVCKADGQEIEVNVKFKNTEEKADA